MLTILVACKEPRTPGGLDCLDVPYRILYNSAVPWGKAANQLLDYASAEGGDALFLDDDVTLTEGCLEGVYTYYDKADIFGLDLHVQTTGERQPGARHLGDMREWVHAGPAYVAHVSTSAVYIKASALASGLRFPEWDGIHWEDVVYCFSAWMASLRVMAVPGTVLHDIQDGAGSTKRQDARFWAKWHANKRAFEEWCAGCDLSAVPREAVRP